jgi:branched-chain amino acid transport system ATP-binding protein
MRTLPAPRPALELDEVVVRFGGFVAVDRLTLSVPEGQFRAIVGPNGAGKTTAIHAAHGSLRPQTGHVRLLGEDVTRLAPWARTRRGMARTYQVTDLFSELTLLQNLELALHGLSPSRWVLHRRTDHYEDVRERAIANLERTWLVDRANDKVSALSHGEQRQLELAMALANDPAVLLLDEPAAGLSPAERRRMQELLGTISSGMTVIMIEHNLDLVHALADEVTVLHHGSVVTSAPPAAIQEDAEVKRVYLS